MRYGSYGIVIFTVWIIKGILGTMEIDIGLGIITREATDMVLKLGTRKFRFSYRLSFHKWDLILEVELMG